MVSSRSLTTAWTLGFWSRLSVEWNLTSRSPCLRSRKPRGTWVRALDMPAALQEGLPQTFHGRRRSLFDTSLLQLSLLPVYRSRNTLKPSVKVSSNSGKKQGKPSHSHIMFMACTRWWDFFFFLFFFYWGILYLRLLDGTTPLRHTHDPHRRMA